MEIEETIHNYTNNGAVQVNLEKITGLKELEINDKIEKYTKICRTCLNVANSSYYIKITSNEPQLEVEMLQFSLPEVVSTYISFFNNWTFNKTYWTY